VLVSIDLVARLFRVPILRIDGDIVLVDDDRLGHSLAPGRTIRDRRQLTAGRLLALAEAELAAVDDRRRSSSSTPAARGRVQDGAVTDQGR
jgi:hypothetical protein